MSPILASSSSHIQKWANFLRWKFSSGSRSISGPNILKVEKLIKYQKLGVVNLVNPTGHPAIVSISQPPPLPADVICEQPHIRARCCAIFWLKYSSRLFVMLFSISGLTRLTVYEQHPFPWPLVFSIFVSGPGLHVLTPLQHPIANQSLRVIIVQNEIPHSQSFL